MYKSIKNTTAQSWNQVFLPLDQEFISNHTRRDRFFKQIKILDTKGSLDDLGEVILALNETNYFDSLSLMFECSKDESSKGCKERKNRIVSKDELKNILDVFKLDPKLVASLSQVVKNFSDVSEGRQSLIREGVRKVLSKDEFIDARLELIDSFAKKIIEKLDINDREFLSKMLMSKSKESGSNWMHSWLNSKDLSDETLTNLLIYPLYTNPNLINEVNAIKHYYENGMICSFKHDGSLNQDIAFDFTNYTQNYVEILKSKSLKEFFDFSATSIAGMKMASESCSEVLKNEFNVNFLDALTKLSSLLNEKKYYEIFKYALWMVNSGEINSKFENDQYLLNFITTDLFKSALNLNSSIYKHNRDFYPVAYQIAREIDQKTYEKIGIILLEVLREENDQVGKGIAKFWNFFSKDEKEFLFRFIDRHFSEETNFVDLFRFYASMMDEYEDIQPLLYRSYASDDAKKELTYLALAEIAKNHKGNDLKQDFKKFFTRDHILKVLQIISSGMEIPADAQLRLSSLYLKPYISRSLTQEYYYDIKPDFSKSKNHKELTECMDYISKSEDSFYNLIINYPSSCEKASEDNFSIQLYSWMSNINKDFKNFTKDSHNLFDAKGVISPRMISGTLAAAKALDESITSSSGKKGLSYLMSSLKDHLYNKGLELLGIDTLKFLNNFLKTIDGKSDIHRSSLIKEFTKEETFSQSRPFFNDLSLMLESYSTWVKNGELEKFNRERADKIIQKKEFECESVMNTFIYANSCPSKELVKKHLRNILVYMTNVYEKPRKSGIHHLVKATSAEHGIKIPYQSGNQKTHQVSLGETFKYLYDTTDRNLKVNNIETYYVNKDWKSKRVNMSTLERVEVVIRDVKFKNNYLGSGFLNGVVRASNYDEEVRSRKDLMSKCIKIPGVRCFRKMTDDQKRQAENALYAFDSLIDVNNGRGLEPRMKYGNYLQAFELTLVASSSWAAQEVKLLPLKDELLYSHNGRVLGEMTMINLWSNTARIVRDRFGRTREDFEKFIKTDMKRVDKAFLRGFNIDEAGDISNRLIKKLIAEDNNKNSHLDTIIDWAASLNYEETRITQEVLGRMMLMSTYLGSPKDVFGKESNNNRYKTYADNNIYELFKMSEVLVDNLPSFIKMFPGQYKLVDALDVLNNALIFLNTQLKASNDPDKNIAYRVLNESFNIMQSFLFDEHSETSWYVTEKVKVSGQEIVKAFVEKPENIASIYDLSKKAYDYLNILHLNNASSISEIAKNAGILVNNNQLNFSPLRDYLNFITNKVVCMSANTDCANNEHYDELIKLVDYLLVKEGNKNNFQKMNEKLFVENIDQLNKLLDDLIPAIRVHGTQNPKLD